MSVGSERRRLLPDIILHMLTVGDTYGAFEATTAADEEKRPPSQCCSSCHIPPTVHSGRHLRQPNARWQTSSNPTDSLQASPFYTYNQGTDSHLLEDLAVGLELVLLTQHLPRSQTVSLWKPTCGVFKYFVQGVHAGVQPRRQLLLAVDGPVRPRRVSANGAGLDAASSFQVATGSREEVPGYEGDDRVHPDDGAEDLQQHGVHVLLQLHVLGEDGGAGEESEQTCSDLTDGSVLRPLWLKVAGGGFQPELQHRNAEGNIRSTVWCKMMHQDIRQYDGESKVCCCLLVNESLLA